MRLASADVAAPFLLDVLARDGMAWVRESTDSMAPLVRAGDRLQLAPVERGRIRPGDLVACRVEARLIVHRVLTRDASGVVTKGDALPARDGALPWGAVVGRVVAMAGENGRVHDLTAFPWPALGRVLARLSPVGDGPSGTGGGAGGMLARAVAHLVARVIR